MLRCYCTRMDQGLCGIIVVLKTDNCDIVEENYGRRKVIERAFYTQTCRITTRLLPSNSASDHWRTCCPNVMVSMNTALYNSGHR